jgi:hypothetical protein
VRSPHHIQQQAFVPVGRVLSECVRVLENRFNWTDCRSGNRQFIPKDDFDSFIGLNSQPNQICRNAPAGAGQRAGKELSGGRFELNHYFRDTLGQPLARAKVKGEL